MSEETKTDTAVCRWCGKRKGGHLGILRRFCFDTNDSTLYEPSPVAPGAETAACRWCGRGIRETHPICANRYVHVQDGASWCDDLNHTAEPSPVAPGWDRECSACKGNRQYRFHDQWLKCGHCDGTGKEPSVAPGEAQRGCPACTNGVCSAHRNQDHVAPGREELCPYCLKPIVDEPEDGGYTHLDKADAHACPGKFPAREYERPEPQGQIPEDRLRQIAAAGKLWCGTPEAPSMAEELLSLREERDRQQNVIAELDKSVLAEYDKFLAAIEERDRVQAALRWAWRISHTSHNPLDANQCEWPICVACRAALKPVSDRQPEGEKP